jgi:hypothetical protein
MELLKKFAAIYNISSMAVETAALAKKVRLRGLILTRVGGFCLYSARLESERSLSGARDPFLWRLKPQLHEQSPPARTNINPRRRVLVL